MTILTPMDQLNEQERIHKKNLLDLNKYPLRSEKRGKYLRAFYNYKTKYIKNYKKELYHTWRVKTCKCVCVLTTNQNLQKHKQSKTWKIRSQQITWNQSYVSVEGHIPIAIKVITVRPRSIY